jgi:hypothetical protein
MYKHYLGDSITGSVESFLTQENRSRHRHSQPTVFIEYEVSRLHPWLSGCRAASATLRPV